MVHRKFVMCVLLSEYSSMLTPSSARSLSSPGKRDLRATFGPGSVCYFVFLLIISVNGKICESFRLDKSKRT